MSDNNSNTIPVPFKLQEFVLARACNGTPGETLGYVLGDTIERAAEQLQDISGSIKLLQGDYILYASSQPDEPMHFVVTPTYLQELPIEKAQADTIKRHLNPQSEADYQGEDSTISNTVQFPDGMQMDIKCCGAQDGASWTEAVLFDAHGCELCCSEVFDQYDGPWVLPYEGKVYMAEVAFGRTGTGD